METKLECPHCRTALPKPHDFDADDCSVESSDGEIVADPIDSQIQIPDESVNNNVEVPLQQQPFSLRAEDVQMNSIRDQESQVDECPRNETLPGS